MKKIILTIVGILLMGCAPSKKTEDATFEKLTELIDQYAQNTLNKGNINSLAVSLYKDGAIYQNYYGEIDNGVHNTPNDNTLYEIASISKVFVGSLAAKAVLERKITLDDDINTYLNTDFPRLEFEGQPVTIRNLLTHTLGFKTPNTLATVYKKTAEGYYENRAFDYNMNKLFEELKTVELDKKPGTYYDYNNIGPELVAHILEQVYKRPYKDLLTDFFKELDMNHSYLQDYDAHKDELSTSYDKNRKPAPLDKNPLLGGAYGIITTLPDLTKFMKFQLEGNAPFIKESTRFLFKDEDGGTGYLWDVGIAEKEGFYYSKTGTSNGVQSGILVCPDSDYGLVLIMNNKSDDALNDWASLYNIIEYDLIEYPKINLWSLVEPMFMENPKEAFEKYRELKIDSTQYFASSNYLNNIGYNLLYDNQIQKAIRVFEFAVSEDPENANLYDSLGEAYFMVKDDDNALKNYKKSLELNPKNNNAQAYILKLSK